MNAALSTSPISRLRTAGLVLGGTLLCAAAYGGWRGGAARPLTADEARAADVARSLSAAYRKVAREIDPAVVSIEAVRRARSRPAAADGGDFLRLPDGRLLPFENGMFERFLGPQGLEIPEQRGQGTGVIVSEEGTVVTNAHVVAGADRFDVTLSDGRKLQARLVGVDRETDVAAIRIEGEGLTAARFGDSEAMAPGDLVVAVGTPYGLAHSVTTGVVSAVGRHDVGVAVFEDLIQTDAAINPGNSGGPLLNLDGEVIGINTAIRTRSGGSDGVGFAIPSRTVERVLAALEDGGRVERGWLGASIQDLEADLARSFEFEGERGALIASVLADSPAERGGLRAGDIVTRVDRTQIAGSKELRDTVAGLAPGHRADLTVWRDGESRELAIELGTRPGEGLAVAAAPERDDALRWGVALEDLGAEQARALDLEGRRGALIAQVESDSPAARAGLRPGQAIVSVDGAEVDSAEACARALREVEPGAAVRLHVLDESGARFVLLRPDDSD